MEAITPALLSVGAVNLVMFPLLVWFIKRYLERFDSNSATVQYMTVEAFKLNNK